MGLIKAAMGSLSGVLADQWKEYFYCEAMPVGTLVVKGRKRVSGRSSNTKGNDNIISNGSIIAVADGQCMCIVEQGKIVDVCAEPGEYTYDMSTEPSIFSGDFGDSLAETFQILGKRFTFGGEAPKDQRVYYFNTREMVGNKYGTPSPVPFRVVDERAGIDIDVSVRCFGEYSFRLANPMVFYANVCGNVAEDYEFKGSELESQMRSEFLTHLQPAFYQIGSAGIRYSAVVGHTRELTDVMKKELMQEWFEDRGIEVRKVAISSITATEEDEKMLKEMQRNAAFMDPSRAAAHLAGATASAMQTAAANEGGAAMAFMGMNMAQYAGGMNMQNLYSMGQQQQQAQQVQQSVVNPEVQHKMETGEAAMGWQCSCGNIVTGKFCPECGSKKPEPVQKDTWTCSCGAVNSGKFCMECGQPKPAPVADDSWTCACGAVNKGKYCPECGAKKPAAAPQYKCSKCGWEPEKGSVPPKFCPECGDPFDNNDVI